MKRLICCLIFLFSLATSYSQRVYFTYLQTESEQPFYVRLNDNVFSSSASGYLILSKLRDSTYSISVGFPQNKWPEQQFKIEVKAKDHGYLLKNFGDKGWGLFDLQTLSVQMAAADAAVNVPKTELKDVSAFTDVLSKAANDPSLKEKPIVVAKKEEPVVAQPAVVKNDVEKKDSFIAAQSTTIIEPKKEDVVVNTPPVVKKEDPQAEKIKIDSPAVTQQVIAKKEDISAPKEIVVEKKQDPPKTEAIEEYKASVVKRRSESSTSEGFGLTFVDEYPDGKKDTIKIVIPNPRSVKMVMKEQPKEQPKEEVKEPKKESKKDQAKEKEQPKEDKKFLDISSDAKEVTTSAKEKAKANNCSPANDNDFLKLRKKMASASNDDGMVSEAAKYFKTKCFGVEQLKNLSTLFLNDAGKYKFFDAAYTHVSDPANFATLQGELKDEYYVNRFKAMLR